MGSNKNKPPQVANSGASGGDPRGRGQNANEYQRERFEGQQNPIMNAAGENWGRATETGFKDYGDIMSQYRDMAGGGGIRAERIGYTDPFKSYAGYEDFSKTGGYTPQDVSAMR